MTLRVGETGKVIRVSTGFDMSVNTDISLTFATPTASTVIKTLLAGEITLGVVDITDPDLGNLLANTYVDYTTETGFLIEGEYCVYLTYTNTATTPDSIFIGSSAKFVVLNTKCTGV